MKVGTEYKIKETVFFPFGLKIKLRGTVDLIILLPRCPIFDTALEDLKAKSQRNSNTRRIGIYKMMNEQQQTRKKKTWMNEICCSLISVQLKGNKEYVRDVSLHFISWP